MKVERLEDGKLLYGKGRLTKNEIDNLQNYYDLAIRRNKNDLDQMKQDVWAIYFHKMVTDEQPNHGLCPKGEDSWCKYNRSLVTGESYSYKHSLPKPVIDCIKRIFRDLPSPDLLRKYLHGLTQNPNESFNSIIWNRLPKTVFVGIETLSLGVHDAITAFNIGNIGKCKVLEKLGINPGANMVSTMKNIYNRRIANGQKAVEDMNKKARQTNRSVKKRQEDQLENPDDPDYGAGLF